MKVWFVIPISNSFETRIPNLLFVRVIFRSSIFWRAHTYAESSHHTLSQIDSSISLIMCGLIVIRPFFESCEGKTPIDSALCYACEASNDKRTPNCILVLRVGKKVYISLVNLKICDRAR
jgi:hypothetical protein